MDEIEKALARYREIREQAQRMTPVQMTGIVVMSFAAAWRKLDDATLGAVCRAVAAEAERDIDAIYSTPQIHTDDEGIHRDDDGNRYRLVEVDGEVTYVRGHDPRGDL